MGGPRVTMGNTATRHFTSCGKSMQAHHMQCGSDAERPMMRDAGGKAVDTQAYIAELRKAVEICYTLDNVTRRAKLRELHEQLQELPTEANAKLVEALRNCVVECERRISEDKQRRRIVHNCAVAARSDVSKHQDHRCLVSGGTNKF